MNTNDWLYLPYGRTFNNLTIADTYTGREELKNIQGEKLAEVAYKAGAKFVVFDSKNQYYALHNTSVSEKHPGLGKRDLVAEIIKGCKKFGIVYVPYIPPGEDMKAGREHPEWRLLDAYEKPFEREDGMLVLCQYGPYRKFICDYLEELATNYEIGGIWLDGAGAKLCYCETCRRSFWEKYHLELPVLTEDFWEEITELRGRWDKLSEKRKKEWRIWVKWIEFRNNATKEILDSYANALHKVKPNLPVIADCCFHGWKQGSVDLGKSVDLVAVESLWAWPTAQIQCLRASLNYETTESYLPSAQYAPKFPLSIPLHQIRIHNMTVISSGGIPINCLYGRPKKIFIINKELKERAKWLINSKEIPFVGVVWSERNRDVYDRTEWAEPTLNSLYGTIHILLEEKIPEFVISDKQLEDENGLKDVAVLVLPDIGAISDTAAENIRNFVMRGGGLVATYRTSLYSYEYGEPLTDFKLADLFGVHYCGELSDETEIKSYYGDLRTIGEVPNRQKMKFLKLNKHPIINDPVIKEARAIEIVPEFLRGKPPDFDLVYPDPMLKVKPDERVEVICYEYIQEKPNKWPFIVTRIYGKGRVVYIASDLGGQYNSEVTWPFIRKLLVNSVLWASGRKRPPFKVKAPLHVQATIFEQKNKNRVILHLLNDPYPKGLPPFRLHLFQRHKEEILPVYDIEVSLKGKFKKVYTVPKNEILEIKYFKNYTIIKLSKLETHLMIVGER